MAALTWLFLTAALFTPSPPAYASACTLPFPSPHTTLDLTPNPYADGGNLHAVLISGGGDPDNNNYRYWNNTSFFYRALRKNGVPRDQIHVLMAAGATEEPIVRMQKKIVSQPGDLDCDGTPDITGPATKKAIAASFRSVAGKLRNGDRVVIYVTDHGLQGLWSPLLGASQSKIWLWGEELSVGQFEKMLSVFPDSAKTALILGYCYSGDFLTLLKRNRCVISAADPGKTSHSTADLTYSAFLRTFTSAVAGKTPSGAHVLADENEDGRISLLEAFAFAEATHYDAWKEADPKFRKFIDRPHLAQLDASWELRPKDARLLEHLAQSLAGKSTLFAQESLYEAASTADPEDRGLRLRPSSLLNYALAGRIATNRAGCSDFLF